MNAAPEPPPPPDAQEQSRLHVLQQYGVLDTSPDPVLEDIVRLASDICATPIALVTLLDDSRQWYKAKVGLSSNSTGSARDISFCNHAIREHGVFIVNDATKDDRFADNPSVTSAPHIRFYAGAPLQSPEGYALGTLCAIDRVPRFLTASQQEALRTLARLAMAHLEMRRTVARLEQGVPKNDFKKE